jgi:hypothetical protein
LFLASPSFAIFNGEYQLTISSNTTFLFTCNFRVEGLKHLIFFVLRNIQWRFIFQLLDLILIFSH